VGLLALLVLVAVLALGACGGSGPTTTVETPTPSPSVAATVSSTPTPTPTHTWTPGASPVPAATFPAQEGSTTLTEASFGWTFKPTVDIQVTDLGYYDDAGNGLRHAHPVGIFDTRTKKLLVKATVQRNSPLEASYRFAKIKPVTLKAGKSYVVVTYAMAPFDPEVNFPTGLVWAPEIEYVDYFAAEGAKKLVYPTEAGPYLFMTPNFKFRPVSAASPAP